MTTDPFAPPPPPEPSMHRVKPKLCAAVGETDCERGHRCMLYAHDASTPHRADHCGHRWSA